MTSKRLSGKVAVITGASRGIGRAVALRLAQEGCSVVIAAKSETPKPDLPGSIHTVAEEVEELGSKALAVRVDVRNDEDIQAMVEKTVDEFGRIDILVNNAGALWWQDVLETPMKRFDLVMGVNVRAAFACTQACLPHLIKSGAGHVLVYSPPIDLSALPGKVAYMISKFGMTMLAIGLAKEMQGKGVAINALWPATAIESQATINFGFGDKKTWRKSDIVADATLEVVTSDPNELTGFSLVDEDFLAERGWTDFAQYRCDPDHEPPRLLAKDLPKVGLVGTLK